MPLASCPRCNRMFDKQKGQTVCEGCKEEEQADIERVAEYVSQHPDTSPQAVAEALGIDHQIVLRAIDEGRVAQVNIEDQVRCGRCGAPAISHSKKLREKCLAELDAQLAKERSNVSVPKKSPGGSAIRDEVKNRRIT